MSTDRATVEVADERRKSILDAATSLLVEGGYNALTIRALAARAGVSQGLLYYYFTDKHGVFSALMQEQQAAMTRLLDSWPRERGVRALLEAMVPLSREQWRQVGRVVAVWRAERPEDAEGIMVSARAQFDALDRALRASADAEGVVLRSDPEIVPYVWSVLMGIADLHAQGWVYPINEEHLTDLAITSIVNHITES